MHLPRSTKDYKTYARVNVRLGLMIHLKNIILGFTQKAIHTIFILAFGTLAATILVEPKKIGAGLAFCKSIS